MTLPHDPPADTTFRKEDGGWVAVPNGLWTAGLSHEATLLLGWLHTNSSAPVIGPVEHHIAAAFGVSSTRVVTWLDELERCGYIATSDEGMLRIHLDQRRWEALGGAL